MEYVGKNKSPYYGVFLSSLLLIIVPILSFLLFFSIMNRYPDLNDQEVIYTSLFFGCGVAWIFQCSCVLAGLLKGTFKVVIDRLKEFFGNLSISIKFAFKYYWENIKSEGVVFWIYFIIINSTLALAIYGGVNYFINALQ